jgi:hypothetical protein
MPAGLAWKLLLVVSVVLSTIFGTTTVSAQEEENASQMFLDVGNPTPGDTIHVGRIWIEGIAFDRAAEEGQGIERIDVFLGDRDQAGTLIGRAALGIETPAADDPRLANSGWTAEVSLTRRMTGAHTLFFYALSAVTGEELVVGVPVQVDP